MHTPVIIRLGTKDDLGAVLGLIRELAIFEKCPNEVKVNLEGMEKDGFGPDAIFTVHVAEVDKEVVGIAIFYTAYSTWKGKFIFLEDLYVKETWRGKEIGRKLFDSVAAYAASVHAAFLKWEVLDWNTPAIEFYKKYNATIDSEWLKGRLKKEQLAEFRHKPIFTEL